MHLRQSIAKESEFFRARTVTRCEILMLDKSRPTNRRTTVKRFGSNLGAAKARELIPSGPANEINFPKFRPKPICSSCTHPASVRGHTFARTHERNSTIWYHFPTVCMQKYIWRLCCFSNISAWPRREVLFLTTAEQSYSIVPNSSPRSLAL